MIVIPSRNASREEIQAGREGLAGILEHTFLSPTSGEKTFIPWLKLASHAGFAAICVSPFLVPHAVEAVRNGQNETTAVCSVISFPHGTADRDTAYRQAENMVKRGVTELDFVMNVGQFKDGARAYVFDSIVGVMNAARQAATGDVKPEEIVFKVIIETSALEDHEIFEAAQLVAETGADYIKTSTGFGSRGAEIEDLNIIRAAAPELKIKASGGIRTFEQVVELAESGASRIGTSRGLEILDGYDTHFRR